LHIGVHTTNFVSTLRVFHSFKKGKGNRPNASIALTSDELNTLYEKGLLLYPEGT